MGILGLAAKHPLATLNLAMNTSQLKSHTQDYIAQQRAGTAKKIKGPVPPGGVPPMQKMSAHQALRYFLKKKAAVPWENLAKAVGTSLLVGGGLTAAGMAVGAGARGVGGVYQQFQANRMFEDLKRMYPEIRQKPQDARKYFDMILAYAPGLMRHHAAIGDFLRRQLEYPMSSIEFIKQLADLQSTLSKTESERPGTRFGRAASESAGSIVKPVGEAFGIW
jgi:hypothetical protein